MKVRILVTLEEIDNGWLDPARKASTCAVAQALVNAKIVRDTLGVNVLKDTVLLRLPNDGDQSVFTVSLAFSEWIRKFDRWTAVRSNFQKWRKQCSDLRRLGRTDLPAMPAIKGKPVPPVTVIIDPEEQHVSIEGEPASKSEQVILTAHYVNQYSLAFRRNFGSVQQLDRQRFMSLYAYLQVLSDVQRSKSTSRIGHPPENKADEETVVKLV